MNRQFLKDSIVLRTGIVTLLAIMLGIPIALVRDLVIERKQTRDSAVREVTEKWGRRQTLIGPVLSVPVKRSWKDKEGEIRTCVELAHFLPDRLAVNAGVSPEIRYRGIYRVVVYNANVTVTADFPASLIPPNMADDKEILWRDAFLTMGMTDLRGIKGITAVMNGHCPLTAEPGLQTRDFLNAGFTFRTPLPSGENALLHFQFDMSLNGSDEFRTVPLGRTTTMTASAPWKDPSFVGDFLPEKREITDVSFNALWKVIDLNRNLPQVWNGPESHLSDSSFGVMLFLPLDEYQKNERVVKYAIMFIALTFLAFTIIDVLNRSPFHPVHYLLVGLALILFFVLLLSLSEHLSFDLAYFVASIPVIVLISSYTRGVTRNWRLAGAVAAILTALYAFLFVLLQLEDYALLLGSVGLLLSLSLVMYLTRGIDWFGVGKARVGE